MMAMMKCLAFLVFPAFAVGDAVDAGNAAYHVFSLNLDQQGTTSNPFPKPWTPVPVVHPNPTLKPWTPNPKVHPNPSLKPWTPIPSVTPYTTWLTPATLVPRANPTRAELPAKCEDSLYFSCEKMFRDCLSHWDTNMAGCSWDYCIALVCADAKCNPQPQGCWLGCFQTSQLPPRELQPGCSVP
ncbi:hypothetical protein EJ06DRAFT_190510 [Trichodelitschia bisporula]|uniref:Extracellular membrane protein CFEM domain-containing protein n=1 Tax=Trichodelitschia bisporula TaxID=703511 RepID=A0A6G1I7Y3_9PEZI|nr:hypothetical protein EJ06DRAFT_190510 [Trichodelitschia bisporula]